MYFGITFADSRGWLDSIKSRLPSFMKCGGGGSSSGGYSSSYGKVGGASASTPITASAYGTA